MCSAFNGNVKTQDLQNPCVQRPMEMLKHKMLLRYEEEEEEEIR
jgi:hypothetical protein